MAADNGFRELVAVLRRTTEAGQLRWEKTPDPLEFKAQLPVGGTVRLLRLDKVTDSKGSVLASLLAGGKPTFRLTVLDKDGQLIEQWSATEGGRLEALHDLHQLAQASAYSIDQRLQSILEALKATFPEKKSQD